MPTKEEASKLTVAELKALLEAAGLPQGGKKAELVERLLAAQPDTTAAPTETDPATAPQAATEAVAAPTDPAPADASAAPKAETQETAQPAQDPAQEPAQEAAKDKEAADGKRQKIVFTEVVAAAAPDIKKLVVVKPAADPNKPITKSDAEKKRERADRFKDPDVEKSKQRAQRFGLSHPELDKEKLKKRAERFGVLSEDVEEERKSKRAARFGIEDAEVKVEARAGKFKPLVPTALGSTSVATAEFEALKKARAERFATAAK